MAIARPLRLLGAACIVLFIYVAFQVSQSPKPIAVPQGNGEKLEDGMKKDPLIDRSSTSPSEDPT